MKSPIAYVAQRLTRRDVSLLRAMTTMFGEAFEDIRTYTGARPDETYLARLLGRDDFIALAAVKDQSVVGGLVAYQLEKFEQARKEIYIYDLAVAAPHRRQGIATALVAKLRQVASKRGAYVIFVQADPIDGPAVALYTRLGRREDVLHFDIAVD